MKKTNILISVAICLLTLVTFSNIAIIDGFKQEKTSIKDYLSTFENENVNNSDNSELLFESKQSQAETILGWQLSDQQSDISAVSFFITAVCVGMSENVVVLVESAILEQYPESRGNSIAEDFQNKVYDPTSESLGIPRASIDYPDENNVALLIVDRDAHSVSWIGVYGGQRNGYEQITIDIDMEWNTLAHEYQHCIHNNLRSGLQLGAPYYERFFDEGMAEFWPNYLGIKTTNRCSDRYMERLESGYGQNIPLMEFAPSGNPYYSANYAMGFAFVFYLYEQFGIDFIRTIIVDYNLSITQAIDKHLPLLGFERNFKEVFFDFQMALRLNKPEYDPKWGYEGFPFFIPAGISGSATSLPIEETENIFHWSGESHALRVSNPDFAALKYTFNGSNTGDFDVHVIGSSFYNSSYTEEVVSHMTINNETQDGELIFILPEKVAYTYINIANANGPDYGYDVLDSGVFASLRDSVYFKIESFDPGLVGTINSLDYADRSFTVTATIDWDLESTLEDNDIYPHVVLYDADGEFAFNLQGYLAYNDSTGKYTGNLDLTDDIKSGDYVIKLFVRGVELDIMEGNVSSSSAPSFLFLTLSLSFISLVFLRKKEIKSK